MIVDPDQTENRSSTATGNRPTPPAYLQDGLRRWGPQGSDPVLEFQAASVYCQELCHQHYENFTVASWLLPAALRRHFCHVYAYCRWADDLADEIDSAEQATGLLDWWEQQLQASFRGELRHPVFVALAETIREFTIPQQPFADLLAAFRRDQQQHRYDTWEDLLDYCRGSANPVGRLVLYLGRCHDERLVGWSDSICSGLQIANFCQDVANDFVRGRIYLPRVAWQRAGYREKDFAAAVCDDRFRSLMQEAVEQAEQRLQAGWPLVHQVPAELRFQLQLFVRGGLAIAHAIRRQQYDVWTRRPQVSRRQKLLLAMRAWWSSRGPKQEAEWA
ncbi:MAG: squalene synthase HpnC [Planctomycetota bacterium]